MDDERAVAKLTVHLQSRDDLSDIISVGRSSQIMHALSDDI